jgi:hypothetical protein
MPPANHHGASLMERRFGAQYEAYRRSVPAWWPRLRPWRPAQRNGPGAG